MAVSPVADSATEYPALARPIVPPGTSFGSAPCASTSCNEKSTVANTRTDAPKKRSEPKNRDELENRNELGCTRTVIDALHGHADKSLPRPADESPYKIGHF